MKRKTMKCAPCGMVHVAPYPEEVCDYLVRKEWKPLVRNRWFASFSNGNRYVEIPLAKTARDYTRRLWDALEDIRAIDKRPTHEVLFDMLPTQERIEIAEREMLRWGEIAQGIK